MCFGATPTCYKYDDEEVLTKAESFPQVQTLLHPLAQRLYTYSASSLAISLIGMETISQQCLAYIGFKNLSFNLNTLHLAYSGLPAKCKNFLSDYLCGIACDIYGAIYADLERKLTDYEKVRLQEKSLERGEEYSTTRPRTFTFSGGNLFTFDCSLRPAQLTINPAICDRYVQTPPEPSVALQRTCGTIPLAQKTYTVAITIQLGPESDRRDFDVYLRTLYNIANSTVTGQDLMTFTFSVVDLGGRSFKLTISFTGPDQIALDVAKAMQSIFHPSHMDNDLPGATQTSFTLVTPMTPRPSTPASIASLSMALLLLTLAAILL